MTSKKKAEIISATLVPGQTVAQFVLAELLKGLKVQVKIGNFTCDGHVHQLDFAPGIDHAFATVSIPDPKSKDEDDDTIDVKVAIYTNGEVVVLPDQPEN